MRIQAFLPVVLMLLLSFTVHAETDVSGSSDPRQLPRFPLSWIVSYHTEAVPEYTLATGPDAYKRWWRQSGRRPSAC